MATKVNLPFTRRALALVLAILLAAVAAVALMSYVRGIEQRTLAESEPVDVFVAKEAIPAGTSAEAAIAAGMITREQIPRRAVVPGTITALGDIEGQYAAVAIVPGEQLIAQRFVSAQAAGEQLEIPEGHHAMSIEVALPPGVAGFVSPGDEVGVLGYFVVDVDFQQTNPDGATEDVQKSIDIVQFVMQKVPVLAVGPRVVTTATDVEEDPAVTGRVLLTVAVTPEDAEKLAFANFVGEVQFTLMPEGMDEVPTDGALIDRVIDLDAIIETYTQLDQLN